MKKYKAVLFDYDGTMADTNQLILDSWAHTAKTVNNGKLFTEKDVFETFGMPLDEAMEMIIERYDLKNITAGEMVTIYKEYQSRFPDARGGLYPNIAELLAKLKEKGIKTGIVTSRTNDSLERGLIRLGVDQYFDAIVGAFDTSIHKPDPTPCILCCEKLGVLPQDAVMLGDSMHDMACANRAGSGSAFAAWSFCSKAEELQGDSKPDYVINDALEVLDLV